MRDRNGVPFHPVLVGLPRPCENSIQLLLISPARSIIGGGSRNNSIPIARGAFDDGPGPSTDEIIGLSSNVGCDAFAFCVEKDDAAEPGLFQDVGVDEVHFAENSKEFALDVEGREGRIWERFKPTSDSFKEVIVDDGLGQRCSGRVMSFRPMGESELEKVLTSSKSQGLEGEVLIWPWRAAFACSIAHRPRQLRA